jgi:hypothetical protein
MPVMSLPAIDIDLLGTRVNVFVDDSKLARLLAHLLDDVRVAPGGEPVEEFEIVGQAEGGWILRHNGEGILQTTSEASLVERFLATLNELVLDEFTGVAIHAGVVAQGRDAIVIPGPSGAGKSTLVAACLRAGFAYVSDEALCVDRFTLGVIPYPRPLMLSAASAGLVARKPPYPIEGKMALTPADLGGTTASVPLRLAHVILADRGSSLSLKPIAPSSAVPELLERSFGGRDVRVSTFELLATAAMGCRAWRLGYEDAIDAAALLRRELRLSQPSG